MTTLFEEEEIVNNNGQSEQATVLDAPDYAKLLKGDLSASAKEYEQKIQSLFKAGVLGCLRNNQKEDAATLLYYGTDFANATGQLTDASPQAKKAVDILTAPDNAYFAFVSVALPMALQFFRNHEPEIKQARITRRQFRAAKKQAKQEGTYVAPPKHPVTIPLPFGRRLTFHVRFHIPIVANVITFFRAQTSDPNELTLKVFSDRKVISELKKHGIEIKIHDNATM